LSPPAFVTPDGKETIATEEDDFLVTEIDLATRTIVWRVRRARRRAG
jgi:hypothetical protein